MQLKLSSIRKYGTILTGLKTKKVITKKILALTSLQNFVMKTDKDDDDDLRLSMIRLAKQYGRYGYRKIAQFLRMEGWVVNQKKIERLWREEGLQLAVMMYVRFCLSLQKVNDITAFYLRSVVFFKK
jgi:hypothetical protein